MPKYDDLDAISVLPEPDTAYSKYDDLEEQNTDLQDELDSLTSKPTKAISKYDDLDEFGDQSANAPDRGALAAAAMWGGKALAPAAAGLAAGSAAATAVAPSLGTGLPGVALTLGTGLVAGMGAAMATAKAQDVAIETVVGKEKSAAMQREMEIARQQHPIASAGGELAANLIGLKPDKKMLTSGWNFIKALTGSKAQIAEHIAKNPEGLSNALTMTFGAGSQGGIEAYNQISTGDFSPLRLVAQTLAGGLFNAPTKLGAKLMRIKTPDSAIPDPKIMSLPEIQAKAKREGLSIKEAQDAEVAAEQVAPEIPPVMPEQSTVSPVDTTQGAAGRTVELAPEVIGEKPAESTAAPQISQAEPAIAPVVKPLTKKQQIAAAVKAKREEAAQTISGPLSTQKSLKATTSQGKTLEELRVSLQKKNLMGEMEGLVGELKEAQHMAKLGQTGLGAKEGAKLGSDEGAFYNQGAAYPEGMNQDSIKHVQDFLAKKPLTVKQADTIQIAHDYLVNRLSHDIPKDFGIPTKTLKKGDTYEVNSEKFEVTKVGKKTITVQDGETLTIPRDTKIAVDKDSLSRSIREPKTKAIKEAEVFAVEAARKKQLKAADALLKRKAREAKDEESKLFEAKQVESIVKAKTKKAENQAKLDQRKAELYGSKEAANKDKDVTIKENDEEVIQRKQCSTQDEGKQ